MVMPVRVPVGVPSILDRITHPNHVAGKQNDCERYTNWKTDNN
jgi:hypothetical protein